MEIIILVAVVAGLVYWLNKSSNTRSELPPIPEQEWTKIKAWIQSRADNVQQLEMICGDPPIGFDYDEQVVFCLPDIDLMEPRAVRYSRGSYGGPTIRVMKGLSFRLGTSVSRSQSVDELTVIDQGTLVLTTKRLAFFGAGRTNSVMLQDVIGTKAFTDGIELYRERKQKVESYKLSRPLTILEGSGAGLPIEGTMITMAIKFAKLIKEAGTSNIAALRRQELKVVPIK